MFSSLRPGAKAKVDLAAPARIGSRIRRDPPPPPPRKVTRSELRQREARIIVIGITTIALAIMVVLVGLGGRAGWSPADTTILILDRN